MRLVEAIVDANHRALAGDARAGLRPADFAAALPLVALTCFDPRLHALLPEVLGVSESDFLWLTSPGAAVSGPQSETARAVALACAVDGGREVVVLGHTDCRCLPAGRGPLAERLRSHGAEAAALGRDFDEWLPPAADERSAVVAAVRRLRASPFLPRLLPVHGLLVDTDTGRLEWVLHGYAATADRQAPLPPPGAGRS
jgi:carbonic anhydrase